MSNETCSVKQSSQIDGLAGEIIPRYGECGQPAVVEICEIRNGTQRPPRMSCQAHYENGWRRWGPENVTWTVTRYVTTIIDEVPA